jgi:hypothetical protein
MNKDTLKTLGGLAVIVIIIAGAFWYGDRQHQQQLSQNQKATQTTSNTAPAAPLGTKSSTPKPTPTKTPAHASTPTPAVAATPPTSLAQTGATDDLLPLAILSGAWILYRRSVRYATSQAHQIATS